MTDDDLPKGFSRSRPTSPTKYVMMMVFSEDRAKAIGLLKQKGPAFLIGKITYPGGQVEEGETLEAAAAREMAEETGVIIPLKQWNFFAASKEVAVFTATGDVKKAQTMELEPVFVFDVESHLVMAELNPDLFAPDFVQLTEAAKPL